MKTSKIMVVLPLASLVVYVYVVGPGSALVDPGCPTTRGVVVVTVFVTTNAVDVGSAVVVVTAGTEFVAPGVLVTPGVATGAVLKAALDKVPITTGTVAPTASVDKDTTTVSPLMTGIVDKVVS